MKKLTIQIDGMTCNHCVAAVDKALRAVAGVESVEVNLSKKVAVLSVDSAKFVESAARDAIVAEGYTVVSVE